jgi:hypothetical protein
LVDANRWDELITLLGSHIGLIFGSASAKGARALSMHCVRLPPARAPLQCWRDAAHLEPLEYPVKAVQFECLHSFYGSWQRRTSTFPFLLVSHENLRYAPPPQTPSAAWRC